jgi:hypothetical protein
MIRPFTLMTATLAALAGAYLFDVKHRAQVLENQLAHVAEQSRVDKRQIQVLQAQWAQETDPSRLQQLANNFTALQPMRPSQLVTLADLRSDLPPAGSAAPAEAPATVAVDVSVNAPAPPASPPAALPLPPPPAPPLLMASDMVRPVQLHGLRIAGRGGRPRPLYSPPPQPAPPQGVTPAADTGGGSLLGMAADLTPPPQSIGN